MSSMRLSEQGIPKWFSPQHASEKFTSIGEQLATLAQEARKAKKPSLAKLLVALQEEAQKYARHYSVECPIRSIRIMQPSGGIFVILADGTEVLVPQP
jgi:hypothetical protein